MRFGRTLLMVSLLSLMTVAQATPPASDIQVVALFRGKALLSVNGESKLLASGETHLGVTLVSADSRAAVVRYQGVERSLGLNQRIGGGYQASVQRAIQIWPDARGMYYTTGAINGFAVSFLVDTGATSIAMNSATAKRLGIDYRLRSQKRRVATASAVVPAYGVKLKQVTVGPVTLGNIDAVVLEGNQPSEILLGMSFLGRLEMSHQQGAMVLRQKY